MTAAAERTLDMNRVYTADRKTVCLRSARSCVFLSSMISRTILAILCLSVSLHAEVVRIEVQSRMDLSGRSFGKAGEYEKLSGTIYFAVDPKNTSNRIITDIDKAPRNGAGKVEFSSDFFMLKPKDASRGNGTVLYEVSNR